LICPVVFSIPTELNSKSSRYLTPERHFQEWVSIVFIGIFILIFLRQFGQQQQQLSSTTTTTSTQSDNRKQQQHSYYYLKSKLWMKISTLLFYPYVAYTKLSWDNSNYSGRWLLFLGMPVGSMWLLSFYFNFLTIHHTSVGGSSSTNDKRRHQQTLLRRRSAAVAYTVIQLVWISFLPCLFPVFIELYHGSCRIIKQYVHGTNADTTKTMWENTYELSYFCHTLYLFLVPIYYVLTGELSVMFPSSLSSSSSSTNNSNNSTNSNNINTKMKYIASTILYVMKQQVIGTTIISLYYFGIVTPSSIIAGLNVNFLLVPGYVHGSYNANFRLQYILDWFVQGCKIRFFLCGIELIRTVLVGIGLINNNNNNDNNNIDNHGRSDVSNSTTTSDDDSNGSKKE
jgi:hypothetical protein